MRNALIGGVVLSVALAATSFAAGGSDPLAPIDLTAKPVAAPVKAVTETFFGRKVTDNYRYMEALDPQTVAWMKAQGARTRSIMDAIKPRAELEKKVAAFTGSFAFVQGFVTYGGRAFYEERSPGSDNFNLMVRDAKGERTIID